MKEEAVKERHIIVDRPSWISELGIEVQKKYFFFRVFRGPSYLQNISDADRKSTS